MASKIYTADDVEFLKQFHKRRQIALERMIAKRDELIVKLGGKESLGFMRAMEMQDSDAYKKHIGMVLDGHVPLTDDEVHARLNQGLEGADSVKEGL